MSDINLDDVLIGLYKNRHFRSWLEDVIEERVDERLRREQNSRFALVSVRDNDSLAQAVANQLGKPLVEMERQIFGDGEKKIIIRENLRGKHVFVISTMGLGEDPDISLANTLKVVTTLHTTCKVREITVVAPCLWYQAQDKAHARREPISVRNVADDLIRRGMNHIIVTSLHAEQIEIAFESFDHLKMEPVFGNYINEHVGFQAHAFTERHPARYPNLEKDSVSYGYVPHLVFMAPDEGGVRMREELIKNTNPNLIAGVASVAQLRDRDRADKKQTLELIGDVEGKTVIILDDMLRSGSTMFNAAKVAKEAGAKRVIGMATHFYGFSNADGTFGQRLVNSDVDRLIVTNTRGEALERVKEGTLLRQKMTVLDVSPYLARAMRSYHMGDTVKEMLKDMDRKNLYTIAHKAEHEIKDEGPFEKKVGCEIC